MATKKAIIKVCDVCEREAQDDGEMRFGGHPFNDWFHITRHGGATDLDSLRKKKEWDICSVPCLAELTKTIES